MEDRYRLVISITRGTAAGRALQLMARGITVAAETETEGLQLFNDYMDCAHAVLANVSENVVFGVITLYDTKDVRIVHHELIAS